MKYDGLESDKKMKRAQNISKNCELQQELSFAHPNTRFEVNKIFDSYFNGSPLWILFSKEARIIENSWNVSVSHMYSSTSYVSDLSMVGDMEIITRGEDSDMGTEHSEVSILLFSPRVIM